ncbi:MAG: lycopene beta-cyclase CrtY, partial [Caulobacterales bacterium]|nr:lycopene beta-cyclase CrtY [Caulobacterales bacterium]
MAIPSVSRADVVLVGGGLANGLIALRLKTLRPELTVVILERDPRLGGQHTWSHFASDVSPAIADWLAPLIAHRWDGYDVRFPAHARSLTTPYASITSDRFHEVVAAAVGGGVLCGQDVRAIQADQVAFGDGQAIAAPCIIDGRGPAPSPHLILGWQKFLGQELEMAAPHGLTRPIVMDATVDQLDGYRFLYTLPLSPTRLLVEDTRYSDGEALDRAALAADIAAYAAAQGWTIQGVVREEVGILPIALAGDIDAHWRDATTAQVGLRAALFHPVTGYSLPDAARLADEIAALPMLTTATVRTCVEARSKQRWAERAYYRLLNRMLFRAAEPGRRYVVLER